MTDALATQLAIEVVLSGTPAAHVSQLALEALLVDVAPVDVTHLALEVLLTGGWLYTEGRPTGGETLCAKEDVKTWLEWNV